VELLVATRMRTEVSGIVHRHLVAKWRDGDLCRRATE